MQTLLFLPVVSSILLHSFFFPRLMSAVAEWMFTILLDTVWPLCKFRTSGLKCAACGSLEIQDAKVTQKIAIWAPSYNFVGLNLGN